MDFYHYRFKKKNGKEHIVYVTIVSNVIEIFWCGALTRASAQTGPNDR